MPLQCQRRLRATVKIATRRTFQNAAKVSGPGRRCHRRRSRRAEIQQTASAEAAKRASNHTPLGLAPDTTTHCPMKANRVTAQLTARKAVAIPTQ